MPVDYKKYPKNWTALSLQVKRENNFLCQFCLKPKTRRNPLTTHHLDLDSTNNQRDNLACMHASCHLLFHSTFRGPLTKSQFLQICRNYQSQTKFAFIREFEDRDYKNLFVRHKIAIRNRRSKCLKSSYPESLSLPLLQE